MILDGRVEEVAEEEEVAVVLAGAVLLLVPVSAAALSSPCEDDEPRGAAESAQGSSIFRSLLGVSGSMSLSQLNNIGLKAAAQRELRGLRSQAARSNVGSARCLCGGGGGCGGGGVAQCRGAGGCRSLGAIP